MTEEPEMTDAERASYWQGAYERMAARNIELSRVNAAAPKMLEALRKIMSRHASSVLFHDQALADEANAAISSAQGEGA